MACMGEAQPCAVQWPAAGKHTIVTHACKEEGAASSGNGRARKYGSCITGLRPTA